MNRILTEPKTSFSWVLFHYVFYLISSKRRSVGWNTIMEGIDGGEVLKEDSQWLSYLNWHDEETRPYLTEHSLVNRKWYIFELLLQHLLLFFLHVGQKLRRRHHFLWYTNLFIRKDRNVGNKKTLLSPSNTIPWGSSFLERICSLSQILIEWGMKEEKSQEVIKNRDNRKEGNRLEFPWGSWPSSSPE